MVARVLSAATVGCANVLLIAMPSLLIGLFFDVAISSSTSVVLAFVFTSAFVEACVSGSAMNRWSATPSSRELWQQRLSLAACIGILMSHWTIMLQAVASPPTSSLFFVVVGSTLALLGVVLRALAILHLEAGFTNVVQVRSQQELQTSGVFWGLRHPSECGLLLLLFGLACVAQSAVGATIIVIFVVPLTIARIHVEERELAAAFTEQYPAYASKTWRLLPLVY